MKILDVPRSGSYQGITSSRNRFGQYVRTRAIPVNPSTVYQSTVRDRLAANASAWRSITALQRAGWESLGAMISRNDTLGQTYTLNGFAAYCLVNNNKRAAGDATLSDAPALTAPTGLLTATLTLTNAAMSIAYTTTPLPAGARLFAYASPCVSPGRSFTNDTRLIAVTAAAAASPMDIFTAWSTRFGTPITGQCVFFALSVYLAGFTSPPYLARQLVA